MGAPRRVTRRGVLLTLLLLTLATWGVLQWLERHYRAQTHGPSFSLIEEGLYQGGRVTEPPPGTSAVLNLCEAVDRYEVEVYRPEPIADAPPAPSLEWLRRMVAFVEEQRAEGRVVYVHCVAGVSRSGMVVVAYEMKRHGWSRDEALAFVRTRRPMTRPNAAFMELLLEWEKELERERAKALSPPGGR